MNTPMRRTTWFSLGCVLILFSLDARALVINYHFGTGFSGQADRLAVANAAKAWWEMAILSNFTLDIDLAFATIDGPGEAGRTHSNTQQVLPDAVTGTRLPKSATVELNNNAMFYFDATPHDNSEFAMTMENGLFGNCTQAVCLNKWDALSVIKHELGHALGMIGSTGAFSDGKPFTAFTDFANNFSDMARPNHYIFDFLVGGKEGNKGGTGGARSSVPFAAGHHHIDGTATGDVALNKKLMAIPGFGRGQRSLPTPLDIDILGDAFHYAVNDMPMHGAPAAASLWLFAVGLTMLGLGRARRV